MKVNEATKRGRIMLHLICAVIDHHWRWHWAGIVRELIPNVH